MTQRARAARRRLPILKSLHLQPTVATLEVELAPRPEAPGDALQRDAAQRFDAWYHGVLLEALATGWVRVPTWRAGAKRGRKRARERKRSRICATHSMCMASTSTTPRASARSGRARGPIRRSARRSHGLQGAPGGLEDGLVRVAKALPGVPLLVTENGVPAPDETFRIRYVAAHLAALDRARKRGADVRGYFHWTAVDNYEWNFGFGPERFGLVGFDAQTQQRSVKESGRWLAALIASGVLDPAKIP
jgi:hypothetical protein